MNGDVKKHTVPAFSGRFYTAAKRKAVAVTVDDEALFRAYFWPAHLEAAKVLIAEELERRGISPDRILYWTPTSDDLTISSTLPTGLTWVHYCKIAARKRHFFKAYRVILPGLMIMFLLIGIQAEQNDDFKEIGGFIVAIYFIILIGCGFLFKTLALRILLLRPFGEKAMTKSLKSFVPRNIGGLGYTYTLSDRNYRPNVFLSIMTIVSGLSVLLLCPFFLNSLQVARVSKAKSFGKLQRFLTKFTHPSILSFQNGGQAFNIRSSDAWWKLCVLTLMHSCDVIIVDLTIVKQGTDWEICQIQTRHLLSKCLFVVREEQVSEANVTLARYFREVGQLSLHSFGSNGELSNQPRFLANLQQIVVRGGRFANGP